MNCVGCLLNEAEKILQAEKKGYTIEKTVPTRDFFKVDDGQLYVVRQTEIDGCVKLIVVAKMRKEVF